MSRLRELIDELCPDGVEYKPIKCVATIRNGRDHKSLSDGLIPVYGSGGIMRYVDTSSYDKPSVLIPRKGSLANVFYVDEPFWNVDTIFHTVINEATVLPKYFYYAICFTHVEQYGTEGARPSLTQAVLNEVKVPVPPIEVQREIVRILDSFQELDDALTAEIEAREAQFNQYIEVWLETCRSIEFKPIASIATILDKERKPITKRLRVSGEYPYYGASGIVDYVADYIFDGDYLLLAEDGANLVTRHLPIAFSVSGKIWVNNHAHVLKFDSLALQRVVECYLNRTDLSSYLGMAAQPKLTQASMRSLKVPVPSVNDLLDVSVAIESMLTLLDNLRAEHFARRKQFEYYRDKLISFSEKEA